MSRVIDFFLPKEEKFYEMLLKQTETSVLTAKELGDLVHKYNSLSQEERHRRIRVIHELEHRGDRETHAIIDKLHSSFITPIDREDIHELTVLLDDQIDYLDNVSRKLLVFNVRKIPEVLVKQVDVAITSVLEVNEAIKQLRNHGKVKGLLVKIHDLEEEADAVFAEAIRDLFKEGTDPIEVIKFKDIFETTEAISDNCQAVAVLIEGIVVKNA
ncbi:MAG: DUF47 family protein [Candidatus Micrarchaeota archaeon]